MKCTNCGSPLREGAKFCGKCGHQISTVQNRRIPADGTNTPRRQTTQAQNRSGKYSAVQSAHKTPKKESGGTWVIGFLIALIVTLICIIIFVVFPLIKGIFSSNHSDAAGENITTNRKTNVIWDASDSEKDEFSITEIEPSKNACMVNLTNATSFSEGVAWVKFIDPDSDMEKIGLLGISGKITTSTDLETLNTFGSEFSNGYSYINIKQNDVESFVVMDTNGVITANSPKDGSSYRIVAGGDGVYLVYQMIRGMEANEDRYGFIDAKGNWITEPTSNNPLVYGYADVGYGDELSYFYLGEHVFLALMEGYPYNRYAFYNLDTTKQEVYQNDKNVYFMDADGNPYEYSNGLVLHWDEKYVYSFDSAGKQILNMELTKEGWGTEVRYSEGVFFTGIVDFYDESVMKNSAFYDLYGNKIIDFSKYTVVLSDAHGFYEFHNGVAAVKILGADGDYYIGHINLKGELLYDPIKIRYAGNMVGNGNASGGALYIQDKVAQQRVILHTDGSTYIIPDEVEIWSMYSKQPENSFVFSDGYAWCINNCYFMGVDGQILPTYIEN